MDTFWDILAALAPINQALRILFAAAVAGVLFGAAAGLLPEFAQKKIAGRTTSGKDGGPVIVQTGAGIQINNFGNGQGAPAASPARILVTKFELEQRATGQEPILFDWRIYMTNNGGVGYAPEMTFNSLVLEKPMSPAEIADAMEKTVAFAKTGKDPSKQQQIEPKQDVWLPFKQRSVLLADLNKIKSGRSHLYVFIVLRFLDDTLPAGQYWISEYCGHADENIGNNINVCAQKTYRSN